MNPVKRKRVNASCVKPQVPDMLGTELGMVFLSAEASDEKAITPQHPVREAYANHHHTATGRGQIGTTMNQTSLQPCKPRQAWY